MDCQIGYHQRILKNKIRHIFKQIHQITSSIQDSFLSHSTSVRLDVKDPRAWL